MTEWFLGNRAVFRLLCDGVNGRDGSVIENSLKEWELTHKTFSLWTHRERGVFGRGEQEKIQYWGVVFCFKKWQWPNNGGQLLMGRSQERDWQAIQERGATVGRGLWEGKSYHLPHYPSLKPVVTHSATKFYHFYCNIFNKILPHLLF